ncbi:MAG: amidase [Alphaproteobacteria bacterium]
MSDLDLCYMSAREALARFRDKSLSPVELMKAVLARADAVEPQINAFPFRFDDAALDQAKAAEAVYAGKGGHDPRPLEGLPVAVKDEAGIAGQPLSNASLVYKDQIADETSITNGRLIDAGAIVHARTATPEFSCAGFCHSRLHGVTRNPWNLGYTPGGSSGGSGAALAAGTTTLASGSDIAGSIRIPSSCSGVVGFKPPFGRNPEESAFMFDQYCHVGPMGRSAGDVALMQNVMCGPHPLSNSALSPKLELPLDYEEIKGWRIAYSMDLGFFSVDPEVVANTKAALARFESLGAVVEEVSLPWTSEVQTAAQAHLELIFGGSMHEVLSAHADDLTTYARAFASLGDKWSGVDLYNAWETAARMQHSFGPIVDDYDLFVCPTLAVPAVTADFDQSADTLTIDGKQVHPMMGWLMTYPFNMLSGCPVISVPSGHAANAVPTGIQLVSSPFTDATVFRAASAYLDGMDLYADDAHRPTFRT